MSLELKLIALAQSIGADVKEIKSNQGPLTGLSTTAKTSLVSAINELFTALGSAGVKINDVAGTGDITETWSANKILLAIEAAKTSVTNSLTNGASAALDTFSELATALGNDANFATSVATSLGNRVRFDAVQSLTTPEQTCARSNIGAASALDLANLVTAVGNTEADFTALYNAAKA